MQAGELITYGLIGGGFVALICWFDFIRKSIPDALDNSRGGSSDGDCWLVQVLKEGDAPSEIAGGGETGIRAGGVGNETTGKQQNKSSSRLGTAAK